MTNSQKSIKVREETLERLKPLRIKRVVKVDKKESMDDLLNRLIDLHENGLKERSMELPSKKDKIEKEVQSQNNQGFIINSEEPIISNPISIEEDIQEENTEEEVDAII